ncbi:MAG TPA: hypothetical protein VK464_03605 [Symbiobacteriaceae bacterium]|nr:hypothetical protein [Symbiobacteriaceae bacterium]
MKDMFMKLFPIDSLSQLQVWAFRILILVGPYRFFFNDYSSVLQKLAAEPGVSVITRFSYLYPVLVKLLALIGTLSFWGLVVLSGLTLLWRWTNNVFPPHFSAPSATVTRYVDGYTLIRHLKVWFGSAYTWLWLVLGYGLAFGLPLSWIPTENVWFLTLAGVANVFFGFYLVIQAGQFIFRGETTFDV